MHQRQKQIVTVGRVSTLWFLQIMLFGGSRFANFTPEQFIFNFSRWPSNSSKLTREANESHSGGPPQSELNPGSKPDDGLAAAAGGDPWPAEAPIPSRAAAVALRLRSLPRPRRRPPAGGGGTGGAAVGGVGGTALGPPPQRLPPGARRRLPPPRGGRARHG